jgi:hypothetical protein
MVVMVNRQFLFPPGIEHQFSGRPALILVTVVTALYQLISGI